MAPSEMKALGLNSDGATSAPPREAYTKKFAYDASGNLVYTGWAKSSRTPLSSQAVWAISKNTFDASNFLTDVNWADGNTEEDNIWDNRASLTYV